MIYDNLINLPLKLGLWIMDMGCIGWMSNVYIYIT